MIDRLWSALGVRGKQLAVSLALVLLSGALFGGIAEHRVEAAVVARIEDELFREAGAVALAIDDADDADDGDDVDDVDDVDDIDDAVDALGRALAARVTVVDAGGRVIADSELDGAALAAADNHRERPEIVAARRAVPAQDRGVARRRSATLDVDSLYVARRAGDRVVRVSLPLHEVERTLSALRGFFVGAALVAFAVAVVGAALSSHLVSRRLRALLAAASDIRAPGGGGAGRDHDDALGGGAGVNGINEGDDVAGLARTFDALTRELERNLRCLADERDRFDGLLQAMGEGVVALDDAGRVVLCNPAARQLLGLPDDVIGRVLSVPALGRLVDDAVAGRGGSAELEIDAPAHATTNTPTNTTTNPTTTTEGGAGERRPQRVLVRASVTQRERSGVVLVVHDVSEIRRLETLRKDFVANVSHELRTPCSVILANAETLLSGALDDGARAHKFVEAMHRNAERLSRLIADLLELSKIEAGKAVFAREPVNLRQAAEHVVEAIEPRARAKDLGIAVDVDDGLLIEGDPKALDQVLINLIDNAVKYTPAGGHVQVRASRRGSAARLVVEDDGPGVEGKHKDRLFERFYRVDSGRSRDVGGTGLGLAIVKHLVEAMDGTVGVEDAMPHGTRFWVELPLSSSPSDA